jgi:hypothetical protein
MLLPAAVLARLLAGAVFTNVSDRLLNTPKNERTITLI